MGASNAQGSASLVRVDQAAASVEYQNNVNGAFGLQVAPPWESAGLSGEFMSLAGNGMFDRDNADITNRKAGLDPVGRTSMRYSRQNYEIYQHTHSLWELSAAQYGDLLARAIDPAFDYIRRHAPYMVQLHSSTLARRFASTGADRAFTAEATDSEQPLDTVNASLRAIVERALEYFFQRGAFGAPLPGTELLVTMSRRVSRRARDLVELAEATSITNLAATGESVVRSGFNTESALAAMVSSGFDSPIPMRLVIDTQYDDAGDPFLDDAIYFTFVHAEGQHSFASTPIPDWGQTYNAVAGLSEYANGQFAAEAGGNTLGIVVENDITVPLGKSWHIEQQFGLHFYGEGTTDIERNLGYRVPVDLGS